MDLDILLCDLDAFFASVEQRDRAELRGKPVIVGGPAEARSVVSTCSYEARRYGVRSAMPVRRALQLCPEAIVVPADLHRYQRVSGEVAAIYTRFTPDIESVSIDEAYLAVRQGEGMATAAQIRSAVRGELGLPVSVGVSVNKVLAKIACTMAKPDGTKALWPADVSAQLWPLTVRVLPGIGPKTAERLGRAGVKTVGDLAASDPRLLKALLGGTAMTVLGYAQGKDSRTLKLHHPARSVSEEVTFPYDVIDEEYILSTLMKLCEGVGYRLRGRGCKAKTLTLKLRNADFRTITRSVTLPKATDRDDVLYHTLRGLFYNSQREKPWRLVGVRASSIERWEQMLFVPSNDRDEKARRLGHVMDSLRNRFEQGAIGRARGLGAEQGRARPPRTKGD